MMKISQNQADTKNVNFYIIAPILKMGTVRSIRNSVNAQLFSANGQSKFVFHTLISERRAMKHKTTLIVFVMLVLAVALVKSSTPLVAQSGGTYDLTWSTIDGGGGMFSAGGTYSLGGTIGQADTGTLIGGAYTLTGGFWFAPLTGHNLLYLPLILKGENP
jgi:hypothetical protein